MIWGSTAAMTIFDVTILIGMAIGLWILVRSKDELIRSKIAVGPLMLVVGLVSLPCSTSPI